MRHSQIAYQNEQLLLKKFFDSMISLESDKIMLVDQMTA